jgi:hypothetical protein
MEIDPDLGRNNPPKRCNKVVFPFPEFPVINNVSDALFIILGKEK